MATRKKARAKARDEPQRSAVQGYHFLLKVALLGDDQVGKTQLLRTLEWLKTTHHQGKKISVLSPPEVEQHLRREVNGEVRVQAEASPSIYFNTRDFEMDDKVYRVQYWDCPGSERYQNLTAKYASGSAGILLLFDLTRMSTFEHLNEWVSRLEAAACANVPMILVGNKDNCLSAPRQVPRHMAEAFAARHGMEYYETDALAQIRCAELFHDLTFKMVDQIGNPAEPKDLIGKGIKIGPLLLSDKRYKRALHHPAEGASKASFTMDWL